MKKNLLFLAAMIFVIAILSFVNKTDSSESGGIKFFTGKWKEAVAETQKQNKPIFLDIYASWCGPCKMLKWNTFSNNKVAEYYNSNFINVSFDGEKAEGEELAAKLQISGYPSLCYFNKSGVPILYSTGYIGPKEFIDIGKQALSRNK